MTKPYSIMRILFFFGPPLLVSCVNYTGDNFNGLVSNTSNQSLVYIYSAETGCVDLGQMNTDILVNGEKRLTLAENSFAVISLTPGMHTLSASTDDQLACHETLNPGTFWPPVNLVTQPAELYFLQYNGKSSQCLTTCSRHLVEVGEELAVEEMTGAREVEVLTGSE